MGDLHFQNYKILLMYPSNKVELTKLVFLVQSTWVADNDYSQVSSEKGRPLEPHMGCNSNTKRPQQ